MRKYRLDMLCTFLLNVLTVFGMLKVLGSRPMARYIKRANIGIFGIFDLRGSFLFPPGSW